MKYKGVDLILTRGPQANPPGASRPADEIPVTSEMIEAGVKAALPHSGRCIPWSEIVAIYWAMRALEPPDDSISFIRAVGEELVEAGYPAGDRTVIMANLRDALRRLHTY